MNQTLTTIAKVAVTLAGITVMTGCGDKPKTSNRRSNETQERGAQANPVQSLEDIKGFLSAAELARPTNIKGVRERNIGETLTGKSFFENFTFDEPSSVGDSSDSNGCRYSVVVQGMANYFALTMKAGRGDCVVDSKGHSQIVSFESVIRGNCAGVDFTPMNGKTFEELNRSELGKQCTSAAKSSILSNVRIVVEVKLESYAMKLTAVSATMNSAGGPCSRTVNGGRVSQQACEETDITRYELVSGDPNAIEFQFIWPSAIFG